MPDLAELLTNEDHAKLAAIMRDKCDNDEE